MPKIQPRHSVLEDIQALVIGTLLASLGVTFFKSVGILMGGTAGLAFLGQYASQFTFGEFFFAINLPFYLLSYRQLGLRFTLKTFVAVLLLSLFVEFTPTFLHFGFLQPLYAAIVGGLLIGSGLLILLRHEASLGGLTILAQYLSKKYAISLGKFQLVVDCMVLFLSVFIVDWTAIVISIIGVISYSLILVINHKPGRYSA